MRDVKASDLWTEAEFMQTVVDMAHAHRWLVYHVHDSRASAAGFPDLVAIRLSRVLFIETKAENGKLSREQAVWLDGLRLTGKCEVYLWRPHDMEDIRRVLA